jgi:formylmethanofuran:tetrahydromethanopterin formyltransferase
MEEGGELGMEAAEEGEELAAEAAEEDPLAAARRKFFKPERKPERSPGTAVMIAMQAKKPMDKKMGKGGKA